MINPDFLIKLHAKLALIVQGGERTSRERALDLLAEHYAKKITSPALGSNEYWVLRDSWFLAAEGLLSFDIRAEIQRNFLVALDLSAESEIDSMGTMLSTDLWVDAAAANLAPEAKERVSKEIEAHYEEALEEEQCSGKACVPAHLHALKRLGDPRVSAKIFRKTYLTAREDNRLSKILKPPKDLMSGKYGGIFPIFVAAFWSMPWLLVEPMSWFLFLGSFVVVKIVISQIVPRLIIINNGRRAYTWILVSVVFLFIAVSGLRLIVAFLQDLGILEQSLILASMLGFLAYIAYSYSFLARKRLPFPEQQ